MLSWRRPSSVEIRAFLDRQGADALSYPDVGMTRAASPAGYRVGHQQADLGRGASCFERARRAVDRWAMFDVGWVQLCFPDEPPADGRDVAVLARIGPLWSLNACRVVYTLWGQGDVERYGFAYGTLRDHMEIGEERFLVEWDRRSDAVVYDVTAYSRPRHVLARVSGPVGRAAQDRFRRDSARAIQRAVSL